MLILKLGSKGPMVVTLKEGLRKKGFTLADNDEFDKETESVVRAFQRQSHINADGIVGGITWRFIFDSEIPRPVVTAPLLQKQLPALFGSPLEPSFATTYIVWIDLLDFVKDFRIVGLISPSNRCGFYGHYLMEKPFKQALLNVRQAKLQKELKIFNGCHVVRNMRGRSTLSTHAYGLAVDFNANENPFNSEEHSFSDGLLACFADAGFENGGLWDNPTDFMHFQACHTRIWGDRDEYENPALIPTVPVF